MNTTGINELAKLITMPLKLFSAFLPSVFQIRLEFHDSEKVFPLTKTLEIHNVSKQKINLMAVGYFTSNADIHWLENFTDYRTNCWIKRPASIEANTSLPVVLAYFRDIPDPAEHRFGICIQLNSRQIYVFRGNLSKIEVFQIQMQALVSRVTLGVWALGMNRAKFLPSRS